VARGWRPDWDLGPDLEAFRAEVRAFLVEAMAPARTVGRRDVTDLTGWDESFEREVVRAAGAAGLLGVSMPRALGGRGEPRSRQAMLSHDAAYHDAPLIDTAVALVAPTVIEFGSDAQRDGFVRDAVAGTVLACIAYTEAGAGSDLSNVATTARAVDGGYVLDGEKVLVTGAHKADWCCTVARTDPASEGRRGLSMFLLPMRTPGVAVERVPTANRWTLGTIRFEHAEVPSDTLLGTRDEGWRQLTAALLGERSGSAWLGWAARSVDALRAAGAAADDETLRDALSDLEIRLFLGYRLAERVLRIQDGGGAPFVEGAMSKVWATELLQRIARVGSGRLGATAGVQPGWFGDDALGPWFAYETVERLHPTLSVGANEIQRTTLADAGLGLPREPR
jgi:alkylation response protein AidB-like acyl-CoA dehydrogenase